MSDLEGTVFNVFTHKVVMHVDVFCVCMEMCFLHKSDCASIIDGEVGCWGGCNTNCFPWGLGMHLLVLLNIVS